MYGSWILPIDIGTAGSHPDSYRENPKTLADQRIAGVFTLYKSQILYGIFYNLQLNFSPKSNLSRVVKV